MAPLSASATVAPLAPPPPKERARIPARRGPANAASAAAAVSAALLALTPAAPAAALSKEDVAGSLTKVRTRPPARALHWPIYLKLG